MQKREVKNKQVVIIGAGLGGLAAASYLAKQGFGVTVLEKNSWLGGRLQTWEKQGFIFDMGPSFYWMSDVMDNFFKDFKIERKSLFALKRLDPSYRIYFRDEFVDLPAGRENMIALFEKYEKGAGKKLNLLLDKTKQVYEIALNNFIAFPYRSHFDVLKPNQIMGGLKILSHYNGFQSVEKFLRSYFKNEKLIKMLSFPIFFLGESTKSVPSVYSMMNHVDIDGGTWYPKGGFAAVAHAFAAVAKEYGVKLLTRQEVNKIITERGKTIGVKTTKGKLIPADIVIANSDYPYVETKLLSKRSQTYSDSYWDKQKLAPSAFLMYLGLKKQVPGLKHHTLFFNNDWNGHNDALFAKQKWPEKPLYYVSAPTKTDKTIAPKNNEILTILVPIASGLKDSQRSREKLANIVLDDMEQVLNFPIRKYITVKRYSALDNMSKDYNAYKGNAYGLAHTMNQTAIFRPRLQSPKIKNLFYCGQFTIPGIGVPLVVMSGKIAAQEIQRQYGN